MSQTKVFELEWGGGNITADELAWMIQECHPHKDDFAVREVADPERLRLLETLAEAVRSLRSVYEAAGGDVGAYLFRLAGAMGPVMEASAALEALDGKEIP